MSWRRSQGDSFPEELGQASGRKHRTGKNGPRSGTWDKSQGEDGWDASGWDAGASSWSSQWQETGESWPARMKPRSEAFGRSGGRGHISEADRVQDWRAPASSQGNASSGASQPSSSRPAVAEPAAEQQGRRKGGGKSSSNVAASSAAAAAPLELPIDEFREKILSQIREQRVTHIQGETGCGKSTRLPQFILEDAKERGEEIRMVVTQPRRMAAVTLAKRVASVVGEELGQGTVGYRISGDTIDGRLCFVTVGYLLQRLVNNPEEFGRYTHVILDEVHERGVDADLLSMLIKLLMHCFPSVKLVVMSATLQASLFADYFASLHPKQRSPVLAVGARCHPVKQLFLDDLQSEFDFWDSKSQRSLDDALKAFAGLSKGKGKGKGKDDKGKGRGKGGDDSGFKRVEPQISQGLMEVTADLVQQLAEPGCTVIVFLPGIADITSLFEVLAPLDDSHEGGGGSRFPATKRLGCPRLRVYAMHSMIPREEQEEVFGDVPKDACHIVLASNIAESSLTLPSVCAVVDLALRRTIQYDTRRLMCCLVTTWCSQSSCKQRRGRAGRTMPGRAVCLVPRRFFEEEMPLFDPPEMMNAPLTKLYLQAKTLCQTLSAVTASLQLPPGARMDVSKPKSLLNEVVQPPAMDLLEAAMEELAAVGCLTNAKEDAEITPLGRVAMVLPCDLRICRLLYLGCLFRMPVDALAMAAALTAADPFSAPSKLVLKDQRDYVQKLGRSFASRRWCDHGTFSEPIMMHSLLMEWVRVGAPRGVKALGSFVREWSVIPKKFESLTSDAMDLTVRMMKLLKPRCEARRQIEDMLAAMHHRVDKHEELERISSQSRPERIFSRDTDRLRALLALSFSDQMLMHLNPRWVPSGGKKKKQEEQVLDVMYKHGFEPLNSVALFAPQGQDEDSIHHLCEAMTHEAPEHVVRDEKAKIALVAFKPSSSSEALDHEDVLLWDVPSAIHRMHMFGSGRYRFFVELPGSEEGPVELLKPLQPFALQWEVLSHPGWGQKKKKPSTVKGMCDWRNPIGFACHVDDSMPPAEFVGCCASVQGLEGGSQAFVAGASVLPLKFLPVLLGTLCPERWSICWGMDVGSSEVRALKILHHEFVNLPPKTLAPAVLEAVNALRGAIKEALYPPHWWDEWEQEAEDEGNGNGWSSGKDRKGRKGGDRDADLLDPPDLRSQLTDLLEILPTASAASRPKKLKWRPAATFDEEWAEDDFLRPLQELSEREDQTRSWSTAEVGGGDAKEFAALVEHLSSGSWFSIAAIPKKIRKAKKQLEKRKDLFELKMKRDGFQVRLRDGVPREGAGRRQQGAAADDWDQNGGAQAGVSKQQQPLVDIVRKLLKGKPPIGLGELGSQASIKKLLLQQKGPLQKIRPFLAAFPRIFEMGVDAKQQVAVQLAGAGGSFCAPVAAPSQNSGKGAKGQGQGGGRSSKKGGDRASVMTERIAILCKESPATPADFDYRVRSFLMELQGRQGVSALEDAFDMLHEWLCKKEDRSHIHNWPGYIMKLLMNWRNLVEEAAAEED